MICDHCDQPTTSSTACSACGRHPVADGNDWASPHDGGDGFYEPVEVEPEGRSILPLLLAILGVVAAAGTGLLLWSTTESPPSQIDLSFVPPPKPLIGTETVGELGEFGHIGMPFDELEPRTKTTDEPLRRTGRLVYARTWWDCTFTAEKPGDVARLAAITCVSEPVRPQGMLSLTGVVDFSSAKYGAPTMRRSGGAVWIVDNIEMSMMPAAESRIALEISPVK